MASAQPIRVVVTDIEGTTTPIAYVHRVLFGYAREHLTTFLATHENDAHVGGELRAALDEVRALAPDVAPEAALRAWMDEDAKVTPLKTIQGLIWRQGYESGALEAEMHADVPAALRAWQAAGLRLAVYSSGSEAAQRLIFGHSAAGDLAALFEAFFDTRIGAKREVESYRRIAAALGGEPGAMLFLSDVEAELDAAASAGFATIQLVRPEDGTVAGTRHKVAHDFHEAAALAGLPGAGSATSGPARQ